MSQKVLVVGSGVVGLRTALELLHRKIRVCLVSPRPPLHPSTCSMGAGGLWMPFHCDDARTDRWAFETLDELLRMTTHIDDRGPRNSEQNELTSDQKLVEVLPAISFKRKSREVPGWAVKANSEALRFRQVDIDTLYRESRAEHFRVPEREIVEEAGYSHAWLFHTPVVDSPKMLMHMLSEIKSNQYTDHVNVETGNYYTTMSQMTDEAKKMGCNALVNCTGMGAKKLCNDDHLVGARGVLLHFDRNSCVWKDDTQADKNNADINNSIILVEEPPFGSETGPCYLIPRGNTIAVGGTYLEGDTEVAIRQCEKDRIIENAHIMGIDTDKIKKIGEWVGFRPVRSTVRLEVDEIFSQGEIRVVHNYGHGGSGWTVFVGAARDAASLLSID